MTKIIAFTFLNITVSFLIHQSTTQSNIMIEILHFANEKTKIMRDLFNVFRSRDSRAGICASNNTASNLVILFPSILQLSKETKITTQGRLSTGEEKCKRKTEVRRVQDIFWGQWHLTKKETGERLKKWTEPIY